MLSIYILQLRRSFFYLFYNIGNAQISKIIVDGCGKGNNKGCSHFSNFYRYWTMDVRRHFSMGGDKAKLKNEWQFFIKNIHLIIDYSLLVCKNEQSGYSVFPRDSSAERGRKRRGSQKPPRKIVARADFPSRPPRPLPIASRTQRESALVRITYM